MRRRGALIRDLLIGVPVLAGVSGALAYVSQMGPRESSCHRPTCRSNLRQIGTALSMYLQDYDQRLPSPGTAALPSLIHPYIKNGGVWECPINDPQYGDQSFDGTAADTVVSYGFNGNGLAPGGIGAPMSAIQQHSATVSFVETRSHLAAPDPILPMLTGTAPSYRHENRAYTLWLDGHVTAETPELLEQTAAEERGVLLGAGIDGFVFWNRK